MSGGGPKYEPLESEVPDPATLLLDDRKERIDEVVALRTRSVAVVLDRLEDSFNMAAVLRTCEGFGVQDVYVVENPEVRFRPNATVTQGCDKWLTLHTFRGFSECRAALKARGYRVLASAFAPGGEGLFSLRFEGKTALVFGNERHGVSSEVIAESDGTFWIPMRGFTQSFNVSVAVAASLSRAMSWRQDHLGVVGDLDATESENLRQSFRVLSVKQRSRIYKDGVG